jgi:hypothetical protein
MEYFNNTLCITGAELMQHIPKGTYDAMVARKQLNVVRRGCYGTPALIEFDSIPLRYKNLFQNVDQEKKGVTPFRECIKQDHKAIEFYSNYTLANGRMLEIKHQTQYATDAAVLNALHTIYTTQRDARKALSGNMRLFWSKALQGIELVREQFGHALPKSEAKLRAKYKEYITLGYEALISKKFCNDNSRKVNEMLEHLILSLYTMPNKPFGSDIQQDYLKFLAGKLHVVDQKTGEIFNHQDFFKNGKPLEISRRTALNYINQPLNAAIVSKVRSGAHHFNTKVRPHHHRSTVKHSFSQVSMDDRHLPRKSNEGTVIAYYAMDVKSECFIGYSYSLNKDSGLFINCLRNMFQNIERHALPMPLELEVENHLVNSFFDDLRQMFPFLKICKPGNSQDKFAETGIRLKKYTVEKKTQTKIGRFYSKLDSCRVDFDKINDEFVEKKYSFNQLVADDIETIREFNNMPHSKHPGKTRWQVLLENLNPMANPVFKPMIYKFIGDHTTTSIVRNQYVTVQYEKYTLPSVEILGRLLPNNYTVDAYYLKDAEGVIEEVYLYQNNQYLCTASKIEKHSRTQAEWTERDPIAFKKQSDYVAEFDQITKSGKKKLAKTVLIPLERTQKALSQEVVVVKDVKVTEGNYLEALIGQYDKTEYENRAEKSI